MTTTMEIKRTEDGWELSCPVVERDYHIRYEEGHGDYGWILDEFDSTAETDNHAHIEASNYKDITDAMHAAFESAEAILNAPRK
jgi:hypothetical protein